MDSLRFLLWSRLHLIFLPAPHAHVYFKDFSFCSYWVVLYAHRHMLVNPLIQILCILIVVFCVCVRVCVCVCVLSPYSVSEQSMLKFPILVIDFSIFP